MSSGIEILIFAPLLFPGVFGAAGTAVAAAGTAGAVGAGGVVVTGSSIATTGAFATGSIAAGGTAATGVAATGAAVASGAVVVFGAAAAALLAARHIHSTYDDALQEYHQRLEQEGTSALQAKGAQREANALARAQQTKVAAVEPADIAFLRAGVRRIQNRLSAFPHVDPTLPGACSQLLSELEQSPQALGALYDRYTSLAAVVMDLAAKQRLAQKGSNESQVQREAIGAELAELRAEVEQAPQEILGQQTRDELEGSLRQVEHLLDQQPAVAEQSLQLLRTRATRELTAGAQRVELQRQEKEQFAARLRELAGRVSARSQSTLSVLEADELAASPLARPRLAPLRAQAVTHLERLATLLTGSLPQDLAPLEKLARAADELSATAADELRQIALQIYLEEQVTEIFTQLGYRVTSGEDLGAAGSPLFAALGGGHGVEVTVDGAGNMHSELVAFSSTSSQASEDVQEKVCALMDEVFDALRARGCGVREKKRRHFKKGQQALRVVKVRKKEEERGPSVAAPREMRLNS